MGSNGGANKGMHYSHSTKFWRSRYDMVKHALADDETALKRFTSAVKDLDTFQLLWDANERRLTKVVEAIKFPSSIVAETEEIEETEKTEEIKPRHKWSQEDFI